MKDPYSSAERFKFFFKCSLCVLWAIPWVVVGIGLCATGFLIIIGIPLIMIGVRPLARVNKKRVECLLKWEEEREDKEPEHPWRELEERSF